MPAGFAGSLSFPLGGDRSPFTGTIRQRRARDVLGVDVAFLDDRKLNGSGDYVLISGVANVRRAIYNRLRTRPGEWRLFPEYGAGLQDYVKRPLSSSTRDEIIHRVKDQLSYETRVEKVVSVVLSKDPTATILTVAVNAKLYGNATLDASFNFADEIR